MPSVSFGKVIPVTGPNIGFPGTVSRSGSPVIAARQVNANTTNNLKFGDVAFIVPDSTGGTWQPAVDFLATLANIALASGLFAGIANREVKTSLAYPINVVPGTDQVGYYAPGEIAEVIESGSVTVQLAYGNPQSQGKVYLRIVANATLSGTAVGGLEAAADLVATTASCTAGSTAMTAAAGTGIAVGQLVAGLSILPNTYVAAVSGTAVTLSQAPLVTLAGGTAVTFANTLELPSTVFRTGYVDANNVVEITILRRQAA